MHPQHDPPPSGGVESDAKPTPSMIRVSEHQTGPDPNLTGPEIRSQTEPSPAAPSFPGLRILGVLGRGGMGVVYKAHQEALDRLVAVKTIRGRDDAETELLARFLIEARAFAQL